MIAILIIIAAILIIGLIALVGQLISLTEEQQRMRIALVRLNDSIDKLAIELLSRAEKT